jgi:hypothetical protein
MRDDFVAFDEALQLMAFRVVPAAAVAVRKIVGI